MTFWGAVGTAVGACFLMAVAHYYGYWAGFMDGQLDMKKKWEGPIGRKTK